MLDYKTIVRQKNRSEQRSYCEQHWLQVGLGPEDCFLGAKLCGAVYRVSWRSSVTRKSPISCSLPKKLGSRVTIFETEEKQALLPLLALKFKSYDEKKPPFGETFTFSTTVLLQCARTVCREESNR